MSVLGGWNDEYFMRWFQKGFDINLLDIEIIVEWINYCLSKTGIHLWNYSFSDKFCQKLEYFVKNKDICLKTWKCLRRTLHLHYSNSLLNFQVVLFWCNCFLLCNCFLSHFQLISIGFSYDTYDSNTFPRDSYGNKITT